MGKSDGTWPGVAVVDSSHCAGRTTPQAPPEKLFEVFEKKSVTYHLVMLPLHNIVSTLCAEDPRIRDVGCIWHSTNSS